MKLSKIMKLSKSCAAHSAVAVCATFALIAGAAAVPAQARTLSYAAPSAPTDTGLNKALKWWAEEINSCTDGSIDIKFHWMQSLVKLSDALTAVSVGVADIAYVIPAYSTAQLPLWALASGLTGSGDQYIAPEAFRRVRENFPEIKQEEKNNNLKYIANPGSGPFTMVSVERPYIVPADFRGDKVRLPGSFATAAALGEWPVTAVSLSVTDAYSALDRGVIDGTLNYLNSIPGYNLNEVANHVTELGIGQAATVIMMNRDVWNSLSEKEKTCFNELNEELRLRTAKASIEYSDTVREQLKSHPEYPMQIHQLTEEQRGVWEEALSMAWDEAVEQLSRHNAAAPEVQAAFIDALEEVEQEVAEKGYPWERPQP